MMKTGKNKRLLASILAASMLLAMSPFALAEGTEGQEQPVEGGGTEQICAAKIGENKYPTLAGALAAANIYDANSDVTIVMLHDVTENIEINRSLTLDLGGHTLSGDGDAEAAVVTISGDKPQVTVKNGTVTGGKKSGIRITNGDVTLTKLTVTKNASTGNGGGIDAVKGKELVVEQCAINENTAKNRGGGILVEDTPLKVVGSKIENNQGFHGAGIYLSDPKTPVCGRHEITGTLIEGNKVLNDYGIGGGIHVGTRSQVNIENSTISKNAADQGGGIVAYTADSVILNHVVITENQATVGAGILTLTIHACNTEFKLTNNTEVKNNTATYYGGGVMAWGDGSDGIEQVVTVENSSISNNNAKDGAGIFINLQDTATNAFVTINLGVGAVVQENKATRNGGGIFARNLWNTAVSKGTINAAEGSAVYNNTAAAAGDDLYLNNGSIFTLPNAKAMSGDRILSFDNMEITGWYHDGYKWNTAANDGQGDFEQIGRWTAETADGTVLTGEQQLTADLTLHGVWTFTKKSSGGGGGGSHKPTVTIPDDVPTGLNGDDHYAYIVGYPDSTVRPQNGITRAEVATIFFRLLTDETRNANSTKSNSYSDVAAGAWYNHAVSTLSAMGIVKGDSQGKFNTNAPITRAEFAAIAARFDDKANTTAVDFSDIASHWAKDEISAAANNGWINGYTDGTFRPNNKITRAEAMTLVNRVLKRLPETVEDLHNDMIKWSDNSDTSAWYYLAVQEATNSHYYDLKENKHEKWSKLRETRDWTELEK